MTWLLTLLSLIGVVLNVKKQRSSFAIWFFTNTFWCIYDWKIGATAQSALFAIYGGLAVWGWLKWRE